MSADKSTTAAQSCGTYLRKSTDDQKGSIERQRGAVAAYAAAKGYRIVREGATPIVSAVASDNPARVYVDHRYLCMQPRAI